MLSVLKLLLFLWLSLGSFGVNAEPVTASAPDKVPSNAPYLNAKLPVSARVKDLLSRMTYLEQLAQTRSYGGVLGYEASYNYTFLETFNAPYRGSSACKTISRTLRPHDY
jgi:hypothetical protein